jgi:hypothetical protein
MELAYVSPNQNQTPTLGLGEIVVSKGEVSNVSLEGHAHAQSASQRVGW